MVTELIERAALALWKVRSFGCLGESIALAF